VAVAQETPVGGDRVEVDFQTGGNPLTPALSPKGEREQKTLPPLGERVG